MHKKGSLDIAVTTVLACLIISNGSSTQRARDRVQYHDRDGLYHEQGYEDRFLASAFSWMYIP
jgi:hypothetical protein